MLNRIEVLRHLIAQQRSVGLAPVELHANRGTIDGFILEARLLPIVPPDTRSLIARIRRPEAGPGPQYEFEGLKLVCNPQIPGGAIILRPAMLMEDPGWLSHIQFKESPEMPQNDEQGGLQRLPADGSTPWQQKTPKGQDEALGSEEGALAQLSKAGGITPTDCVMKAMDGIEGVKDIIVLRFRKGGDVEMSSTMDRMKVVGALQLAMGYALRQD
jgi:hypothetical protein